MSIEALAMAGVDYEVCGIEFQVWEHEELEQPPPYLLAELNTGRDVEKTSSGSSKFWVDELLVKAKMVESVPVNQIAFKSTNNCLNEGIGIIPVS
ncbi:hypothetical protein ERO13_A02G142600v2 [Gossypium hirsutum]|uniref:Uncharacterized protein n=4 Tax=Gossypium TaxID=3633 RepID=A0ABR0QVS9_GOSAR|nr:hypothetical protein ES319_A02G155800v1 [Gossypium barbadense]KAG4212092.1 hypothetical protein ERO13_A02G142600v2 [Gossypium hirsutum]KAK5843429.1 hypothetical protein PVK06_005886 [Gossypium arboreum]TYI40598.1 hypothetical protein ES332_A02G174000v1 [Gossypium tomentosum]